jgi:dTDP-4-amino-4,6-dideoxygalactose transaminase
MAAVLLAQLEAAPDITVRRKAIWERYHDAFAGLELKGLARRPAVPADCVHNGHLYYLMLPDEKMRDRAIDTLRSQGIPTPFHYVPLHSSQAGIRYGRASDTLTVTTASAERLMRLPLHTALTNGDIERIVESVRDVLLEA